MAKRDEGLIACLFSKRWNSTSAPNSGTTAVANSPAAAGQQRNNLEFLWYSIQNFVGAGGAAASVQVQVRHASETGTLIASIDHLVPASTTANVSISNMGIAGKRGTKICVLMNTVIASLTQKVNIAGWVDDANG